MRAAITRRAMEDGAWRRRWQVLMGAGMIFMLAFVVVYRRRSSDEAVLWEAHRHEDAVRSEFFAWRDCTGRAPSSAVLKRSYRRLARQAHPDKQGSAAAFGALEEAQRQLQSPVQYNLRAALAANGAHAQADSAAEGGNVIDAGLEVREGQDGPRIRLMLNFTTEVPRGFWQLGLLAKGVSAIEYSGQDGKGYDLCCDFLTNSKCTYKPYAELKRQHEEHPHQLGWDAMYQQHDCPLQSGHLYSGAVDKPLHVVSDGLWAAVLELFSADGGDLACAAFTFRMSGGALQPLEEEEQGVQSQL